MQRQSQPQIELYREPTATPVLDELLSRPILKRARNPPAPRRYTGSVAPVLAEFMRHREAIKQAEARPVPLKQPARRRRVQVCPICWQEGQTLATARACGCARNSGHVADRDTLEIFRKGTDAAIGRFSA